MYIYNDRSKDDCLGINNFFWTGLKQGTDYPKIEKDIFGDTEYYINGGPDSSCKVTHIELYGVNF